MRLRIRHVSRYGYDRPVAASFNEARLTPLRTPWQTPLESVVRVDEATWRHAYVDYWGTQVQAFEAQRPHSTLVVEATSLVEVDPSRRPPAALDTSWDELRADPVVDRWAEYLVQTRSTAPDAELAALAEESAATAKTPHDAALLLCTRVHAAMRYLPGSTGVHTAASEAWASRSGVCQDYAHLVVGALRHVGVPARYVSGYLHPKRDAAIGSPAVGESHAWVEWWLGEWTAHDPTNDIPVGERHVMVGSGRDYNDVPPIKGIVGGSATSTLEVSVEVARLA